MNKHRIIHIVKPDKFIPSFVNLLEEKFNFTEHSFYIFGSDEEFPIKRRDNIFFYGEKKTVGFYLELLLASFRSDKVIFHGLFYFKVVFLFSFFSPLLKKSYWVIWGGDLYTYMLGKKDFKWRFKEFFRRSFIKRLGHLVTYIKGDYELAKEWYGAEGQWHECLMYNSNVFQPMEINSEPHNSVNIQIGNSADPSNNHLEAFNLLEKFKDEDIKIFVPLSYGKKKYAMEVVDRGREIFKDKMIPMQDFIPFEKYKNFLSNTDIAIFSHDRQQAMGNIITLLGLGKKVYLKKHVTPFSFFEEKEIKVFDLENFSLSSIDTEIADNNKKNISTYFTIDNLEKQWNRIFND